VIFAFRVNGGCSLDPWRSRRARMQATRGRNQSAVFARLRLSELSRVGGDFGWTRSSSAWGEASLHLRRKGLRCDATFELISGRPASLSHCLSLSLIGPSPQSEDAGICEGELEALRTHGALFANLARRHAVFSTLGLHELIAPKASARSLLKPFRHRHISNRVPRPLVRPGETSSRRAVARRKRG